MEAPNRSEQIPRRHLAAMAAVVAGFLFVALSIAWPRVFAGRSGWSEDKAASYQEAASRLHSLSMQAAAATAESQTRAARDELAKAKADYAQLRTDLDTARGRPQQIARILRYAGAALLLVGTIALLKQR